MSTAPFSVTVVSEKIGGPIVLMTGPLPTPVLKDNSSDITTSCKSALLRQYLTDNSDFQDYRIILLFCLLFYAREINDS
jgi:hypothetical protein